MTSSRTVSTTVSTTGSEIDTAIDQLVAQAAKALDEYARFTQDDVDQFIEARRIQPGSLEHLYPEPVGPPRD